MAPIVLDEEDLKNRVARISIKTKRQPVLATILAGEEIESKRIH